MRFILIALLLLVLPATSTWVQYRQPHLYSFLGAQHFIPSIKLPFGLRPMNITGKSIEPVELSMFVYDSTDESGARTQNYNTNFSTFYYAQESHQTYIGTEVRTPPEDDPNTIKKILFEIWNRDTGEEVSRSILEDGWSYTDGVFYINTTQACSVRVNITSSQPLTTGIAVFPPGSNTNSAPSIYQAVGPVSLNSLEADLASAGEWVIRLDKSQGTSPFVTVTVQTETNSPCSNLCYGEATTRGSSGWDLSGQKCVCNIGYYPNPYFGCGSINCEGLGLQFSSESSTECVCQSGYSWDPISQSCQPTCVLDNGSTHTLLSNGQCQCLNNFYWNKVAKQCHANCHQLLASDFDPADAQKCICVSPTAVWSQTRKQCILNCSLALLSTGQLESNEVCECRTNSNWNPIAYTCELQCKDITYSTGEFADATETSCVCIPNHEWVPEELACRRICVPDDHTTGAILPNGLCECSENAMWSAFLQKCVLLNCDEIAYATGSVEGGNSCECENHFDWDPIHYFCVINCAAITNPLGFGTNVNYYECSCQAGSLWEQNSLSCIRQCNLIGNSTGRNINSVECECNLGYVWNEQGFCETSCGTNPGQTGQYDSANHHCQCEMDYDWSYENNACYRLCDGIPYALPEEGPDPSSCSCFNGFHWIVDRCVLNCDGQFDEGISADETKCICEPNALYSSRQKKCQVNCNLDILSTNLFQDNKCVCKQNSIWNNQTNKCECITDYILNENMEICERSTMSSLLSIGIAAGAIISGLGVFAGMRIYYGRKKEEEREGESPQSNKDIVITDT